jgi:hypothetical protein
MSDGDENDGDENDDGDEMMNDGVVDFHYDFLGQYYQMIGMISLGKCVEENVISSLVGEHHVISLLHYYLIVSYYSLLFRLQKRKYESL